MGILNLTPDSFSDGGVYASHTDACAAALKMVAQGADIIDIGGESTRPGATPIPADEELRRILPVIQMLRAQSDVAISVDTYRAATADAALTAGADIINDISGFKFDPGLAEVVSRHRAGCVLMHTSGRPADMQSRTQYPNDDVVGSVVHALERAIQRARDAGVAEAYIAIDPGFGFGKTQAQNFALLAHLGELRALGRPILVGMSRKRMLRDLGAHVASQLDGASAVAHAVAIRHGARIVRAHDVDATRCAIEVVGALG